MGTTLRSSWRLCVLRKCLVGQDYEGEDYKNMFHLAGYLVLCGVIVLYTFLKNSKCRNFIKRIFRHSIHKNYSLTDHYTVAANISSSDFTTFFLSTCLKITWPSHLNTLCDFPFKISRSRIVVMGQ